MAIFSRRTLQRLINENASFLNKEQTKEHVKELNNGKLAFEWEVVLLNVFSKIGKVEHHKIFNSKKPDIYFKSSDRTLEFLADIRTVSDEGIETSNPQKQFQERLSEEIAKKDLGGEWNYKIGNDYEEETIYPESEERVYDEKGTEIITELKFPLAVYSKCKLKLPAISRFDTEIFNLDFDEFLNEIKKFPDQCRAFS